MTDRSVFIMRHGERCDFLVGNRGQGFMKSAFDSNGKYTPFDINLPRVLPKRADGWQAFGSDTPLTEMGYLEAKLTGRSFRDKNVKIDHIYCSPALRCVQTAVGFLKGMGTPQTFKIEPGLFEWLYWCPNGRPSWMTPNEFKKLGYPVNTEHSPLMAINELKLTESLEEYYKRSYALMQSMLQKHPTGNILLVAHGASLDTCTRQLTGGPPRTVDDFFHILRQTSYLSNAEIRESRGRWVHAGRPVPPMTVSQVATYNPAMLTMSDSELKEDMEKRWMSELRKN